MASGEEAKLNEIQAGSRHAYLEEGAYAEEAELNEIPAGSKHASLEEVASAEETYEV